MKGYPFIKIVLIFLIGSYSMFAQNRGTIRILKPKDTLYIKADIHFDMYLPVANVKGSSYSSFVKSRLAANPLPEAKCKPPLPKMVMNQEHFNYSQYFNNQIDINSINMDGQEADTVLIKIDVLADGTYFYNDLTKMMKISNKVVAFDEKNNAFRVMDTHLKVMKALKDIMKWRVATYEDSQTRKNKTVVVPANASGILVVLFSKVPLN